MLWLAKYSSLSSSKLQHLFGYVDVDIIIMFNQSMLFYSPTIKFFFFGNCLILSNLSRFVMHFSIYSFTLYIIGCYFFIVKTSDWHSNGLPCGDLPWKSCSFSHAEAWTVNQICDTAVFSACSCSTILDTVVGNPSTPNNISGSGTSITAIRGVARIFGLGGQTVPCRAEPDPASTEVVKSMRGVWVLPHKKFANPNAWNAFFQHLAAAPSP